VLSSLQWLPSAKNAPSSTVSDNDRKDVKKIEFAGKDKHRQEDGSCSTSNNNYTKSLKARKTTRATPTERLVVTASGVSCSEIKVYQVANIDGIAASVNLEQQLRCNGRISKIRHMPQRPNILAAQCDSSGAGTRIFKLKQQQQAKDVSEIKKTKTRASISEDCLEVALTYDEGLITGKENSGPALSWNQKREGELLTSGSRGSVFMWDISELSRSVEPRRIFESHQGEVTDIAWKSEWEFLTAGDDGYLRLWDKRDHRKDVPCASIAIADGSRGCTCVRTCGSAPNVVATAAGEFIDVRDLRMQKEPMKKLQWHGNEVLDIAWLPTPPNMKTTTATKNILASASSDRRVAVWDLSSLSSSAATTATTQFGEGEDEDEGPPELLFVHGGHISSVTAVDWSYKDQMLAASIECDGRLHIWRMATVLYDPNQIKAIKKRYQKFKKTSRSKKKHKA